MSDWQERANIQQDVVCFNYAKSDLCAAVEAYVWDLDKTYLDTKFESIGGLFRTIMEKPFQKRNVPGTAALVQALQESWVDKGGATAFPIVYITASPPQMEPKILEKLKLDGIQPINLFCKDNLKNLRPKRFWRLTKQVGYKLQALLQMRLNLGEDVRQLLWGDDSESDVLIYCLYSDVCSRRLPREELSRILKALSVVGKQLDKIFELQDLIPKQDPVEKVYINLAEDTDAEYYLKFGRRVLPTFNTLQTALDLFQDKYLKAEHVVKIADDLIVNFGFTRDEIEKSFDDLVRRRILAEPTVNEILPVLKENDLVHQGFEPSLAPRAILQEEEGRIIELEGNFDPWVPERIDYLHIYR